MIKIEKLFNAMLVQEEIYRILTQSQLDKLVKETGYPVWVQTLASYNSVLDYLSCGGEIAENKFLEVQNGYIYIDSEECEIDFYSKKEITPFMLPGILETYI